MPKITPNIARQLKQLGFGEEKMETGKKPPAITVNQTSVQPSGADLTKLEKMTAQDKAESLKLAKKLRQELEAEIAKQCQIREKQLQERRQAVEPPKKEQLPPPQLSSKPRRGLFGVVPRRIKSAQQQTQPELSGRRVGG